MSSSGDTKAMTDEITWRRHWKPDLVAKPWTTLCVDQHMQKEHEDFTFSSDSSSSSKTKCKSKSVRVLVKSCFGSNVYAILINDGMTVWQEELHDAEIKSRAQRLNPSIEAPLHKLLDTIKDHIQEQRVDTEYRLCIRVGHAQGEKEEALLMINTKLAGLPFVWNFEVSKAAKEITAEHFSKPVLGMCSELLRRQQELFLLLRLKDKEIADYKAQGARVSRKHLETGTFDDTVFTNNMVTSKDFEVEVQQMGEGTFCKEGQELYRQIMTKNAWLHSEPVSAVAEGESLANEESVVGMETASVVQSWSERIPASIAATKSLSVSPSKSSNKEEEKSSPEKDSDLLSHCASEKRPTEERETKEQKAKRKKKKMKF